MLRQTPNMRAQQKRTTLAAFYIVLAATTACLPRLKPDKDDPPEVETTLFLIGDAGEPDPRVVGAPLESLTVQAAAAPERSYIIFLGDNVYPEGIPVEGRAELADSRRRLAAQVLAVPPRAHGFFIPGNHDWAGTTAFGLYSLRNQERMIASLGREYGRDVSMLPSNGCPGPAEIARGRLRLILIDTQWWLHNYIVRDSASNCANNTPGQVTAELRKRVQGAEQNVVVVGGHHPLMTGGEHGGYCSITGPFRRLGGYSQDILSTANRTMRDSIEAAIGSAQPLVYAGGHDHNLQVLRGGSAVRYLLVSGAGSASKSACAVRLRESYYTSQHRSGFMRLDILKDRGVLLRVYRYAESGSGGLAFSRWLEPRTTP